MCNWRPPNSASQVLLEVAAAQVTGREQVGGGLGPGVQQHQSLRGEHPIPAWLGADALRAGRRLDP